MNIRNLSKEFNLVNYLIEFYKFLYMSCYFIENSSIETLKEFFIPENEVDEKILNEILRKK